jgi:hypothetical protein
MAKASQQIDELSTKIDNLGTVVTDVHSDFEALRAVMEAERENLTESGQAALDAANAKAEDLRSRLSNLDVAVGDADGSDIPTDGGTPTDGSTPVEPTPAPGTEGTVGVPAEPSGEEAPPAGEGTVVSPDFTVDAGDESGARPTA